MHTLTFVGSFVFLTVHRNVNVQHSIIYKAQVGLSLIQLRSIYSIRLCWDGRQTYFLHYSQLQSFMCNEKGRDVQWYIYLILFLPLCCNMRNIQLLYICESNLPRSSSGVRPFNRPFLLDKLHAASLWWSPRSASINSGHSVTATLSAWGHSWIKVITNPSIALRIMQYTRLVLSLYSNNHSLGLFIYAG